MIGAFGEAVELSLGVAEVEGPPCPLLCREMTEAELDLRAWKALEGLPALRRSIPIATSERLLPPFLLSFCYQYIVVQVMNNVVNSFVSQDPLDCVCHPSENIWR